MLSPDLVAMFMPVEMARPMVLQPQTLLSVLLMACNTSAESNMHPAAKQLTFVLHGRCTVVSRDRLSDEHVRLASTSACGTWTGNAARRVRLHQASVGSSVGLHADSRR